MLIRMALTFSKPFPRVLSQMDMWNEPSGVVNYCTWRVRLENCSTCHFCRPVGFIRNPFHIDLMNSVKAWITVMSSGLLPDPCNMLYIGKALWHAVNTHTKIHTFFLCVCVCIFPHQHCLTRPSFLFASHIISA